MTIALILLLAVTIVGAFRTVEQVTKRAELERRELLNRIQHPERVPISPAQLVRRDPPEPDEYDLVGTIQPPKDET